MKLYLIILILFLQCVHGQSIEDTKKSLDEIERARQKTLEDLSNNKQQQKNISIEIKKSAEELDKIEKDIVSFTEKRFFLKNSIASVEENIQQIEKNLSELNKKSKKRLVAIYKNRGISYFKVFFNVDSFSEFAANFKLLRRIIVKDNDLFDKIKQNLIELQNSREELMLKRNSLDSLEKSLQLKQKRLEELRKSNQELLTMKQQEENLLKKQYEEYLASSQKITEVIQDLEKQRASEQEKLKNNATEKEPDEVENKPVFDTKKQREEEEKQRKKIDLIWPVEGDIKISSYFGKQKSEVNTVFENKGIDVQVPAESNIMAAADGTVMYKGQMQGYGKILIIDHGYGLTTLYAHLEDISVGIRQKISKGEYIARVEDKADGSILHFEVRVYGNPENPLNML